MQNDLSVDTNIPEQSVIDSKNADFWNDLCGSGIAKLLGITEATPENLKRFDDWYFNYYPYLAQYVTNEPLRGKKVLEIGLGYGTLGQFIASQGCEYHGLDIAIGPVKMMQCRLSYLGIPYEDRVKVGSALAIPYPDHSFDYVYTIGCLHHTGNLEQCISEVLRVLKPEGTAVVMLYNKNSFRQLVEIPWKRLVQVLKRQKSNKNHASFKEFVRSLYDTNLAGEAAPHTDYVSKAEVRKLFQGFSKLRIDAQNMDILNLFHGKVVIQRERLLNTIGPILGLDLYIVARK